MRIPMAVCIVILAVGCLGRCSQAAEMTRPNIVFVYADDLDFDEIGVYDYREFPCCTGAKARGYLKGSTFGVYSDPRMLTPNIDRLAREGALFTRFYITTAICVPSRYSVMTGRYATRSPGFRETFPPGGPCTIQWNTPLDPAESNIARSLRAAGYRTGLVGKWHGGGKGGITEGIKGGIAEGIKPHDSPTDPIVARKIKAAYDAGVARLRDEFGFDFVERIYFGNAKQIGIPDVMKVHNLEWFTEGALKFIDENREEPFFLYMPLTTPHGYYNANWLKANPCYTPAGVLDEPPKGQPLRQSIFDRLAAQGIDPRNAPATWIDDAVGAILAKLDALGVADNTIVVFSSDHQSRGKYTCYEGARVPMHFE